MKKHVVQLLLVLSCVMFVVSGCAKNELVKKDGPIAPTATPARMPKKDPVKFAPDKSEQTVNTVAYKKPTIENTTLSAVNPIPDAAELKSALEKIYFNFDAATLSEQARATLLKNADIMKKDPTVNVRIEGNCDERGSDEYNMALGEKRAKAAMQYMMTMGVPEKRLSLVSYGKEKPVANGHDETAWAKNRRDEFISTAK